MTRPLRPRTSVTLPLTLLPLVTLPLVTALLAGTAGAQSGGGFDASDASVSFGVSAAPAVGTVGGANISGVIFPFAGANYTLGASVSSAAISGSVGRALVLTGLGAARVRLDGALLYGGGARGSLNASGTLGPVALTLASSSWSAPVSRVDPLAPWAETPTDRRDSGSLLSLSGRYRTSRDTVLNVQGTLGGQSGALAYIEQRAGDLSYRLGGQAAVGALGVTGGATYTNPDNGLTLAADALVGPGTLGLTASLGVDAPFGEGSSLRAYAAYEPWRTTVATRRLGLAASFMAGPGLLTLDGRGGTLQDGTFSAGAAISYTLGFPVLTGTQP